MDARGSNVQYNKVLGPKANYKVIVTGKMSKYVLCFLPNFGTSNAIFSSDDNSSYQNYAWSSLYNQEQQWKCSMHNSDNLSYHHSKKIAFEVPKFRIKYKVTVLIEALYMWLSDLKLCCTAD